MHFNENKLLSEHFSILEGAKNKAVDQTRKNDATTPMNKGATTPMNKGATTPINKDSQLASGRDSPGTEFANLGAYSYFTNVFGPLMWEEDTANLLNIFNSSLSPDEAKLFKTSMGKINKLKATTKDVKSIKMKNVISIPEVQQFLRSKTVFDFFQKTDDPLKVNFHNTLNVIRPYMLRLEPDPTHLQNLKAYREKMLEISPKLKFSNDPPKLSPKADLSYTYSMASSFYKDATDAIDKLNTETGATTTSGPVTHSLAPKTTTPINVLTLKSGPLTEQPFKNTKLKDYSKNVVDPIMSLQDVKEIMTVFYLKLSAEEKDELKTAGESLNKIVSDNLEIKDVVESKDIQKILRMKKVEEFFKKLEEPNDEPFQPNFYYTLNVVLKPILLNDVVEQTDMDNVYAYRKKLYAANPTLYSKAGQTNNPIKLTPGVDYNYAFYSMSQLYGKLKELMKSSSKSSPSSSDETTIAGETATAQNIQQNAPSTLSQVTLGQSYYDYSSTPAPLLTLNDTSVQSSDNVTYDSYTTYPNVAMDNKIVKKVNGKPVSVQNSAQPNFGNTVKDLVNNLLLQQKNVVNLINGQPLLPELTYPSSDAGYSYTTPSAINYVPTYTFNG